MDRMTHCEWCSAPIPASRSPRTKACSDECAGERHAKRMRDWAKARYTPRTHEPKACSHCGSMFTPARDDQKWCSRLCGSAAKIARHRAALGDPRCRKCDAPVPGATRVGTVVCEACRVGPKRNRANAERRRRFKRYGITEQMYLNALTYQNNRCAICGTDDPSAGHAYARDWAIDHDHNTGQFRALLCHSCNLGIGQLGDDPQRLIAAAEYLLSHRQTRAA